MKLMNKRISLQFSVQVWSDGCIYLADNENEEAVTLSYEDVDGVIEALKEAKQTIDLFPSHL